MKASLLFTLVIPFLFVGCTADAADAFVESLTNAAANGVEQGAYAYNDTVRMNRQARLNAYYNNQYNRANRPKASSFVVSNPPPWAKRSDCLRQIGGGYVCVP